MKVYRTRIHSFVITYFIYHSRGIRFNFEIGIFQFIFLFYKDYNQIVNKNNKKLLDL